MSKTDDFYDVQKDHSRVKSEIVQEYFSIWLSILKHYRSKRITYLDLFSGSGRYKDGSRSTPLLIFDSIVKHPDTHSRLATRFYEKKTSLATVLRSELECHPVHRELAIAPIVVTTELTSRNLLEIEVDDCTFSFVDPFGYKPITIESISYFTSKWGSDCIFYLSVEGIWRNLKHESQKPALVALFGETGYEQLKSHHEQSKTRGFSDLVKDLLRVELTRQRAGTPNYFVYLGMEKDIRHPISHFLCGVTKHPTGFKRLLDVFYNHSQKDADDMPLWVWEGVQGYQLDLKLDPEMIRLADRIRGEFRSQPISVKDLVEVAHKNGYLYVKKNIKRALVHLWKSGFLSFRKKPKSKGIRTLFADKQEVMIR